MKPPESQATVGPWETDIRPVVARAKGDGSVWLFAGVAVIGAVLLFGFLNAQRQAQSVPSVRPRTVDSVFSASALPPLYIPEDAPVPPPPPPPYFGPESAASPLAPSPPVTPAQPAPATAPTYIVTSAPVSRPAESEPAYAPPLATGDVLVYDRAAVGGGRQAAAAPSPAGTATTGGALSATDNGRSPVSRVRGAATTVPQGTLIPAVLETALDSTRPGHVRAVVSRDVKGFDGSRVLIPRGSRLFGEYRADLSPGQNRAFVRWTRLVRPDGVAVDIDAPAADALGRAGIPGRVDRHFLESFGSALLQTTLNLGGAVARRSMGDTPVVVAVPGSLEPGAASGSGAPVQPTLHVAAGVSVTVFVAQDLHLPVAGARQ